MVPTTSSIAVTGSTGQLGGELCRRLGPAAVPLARASLDLARPETFAAILDRLRPQALINCAAWTAVDAAESDRDACFAANATAVAALAAACRARGIVLVQLSTDYVFGADRDRREPYREDDSPGPVSVYGASKLAGEEAARACDHLIVRTCGLYSAGDAGPVRGRNFADTMLALSRERPELRVVNDQFCTPSYVPHVAGAILALLAANVRGICHVVNAGSTTWHGFAEELLRQAGRDVRLTAIPTSEYPSPARRPGYGVLSTARLAGLGIVLPDWRAGIRDYLASQGGRMRTV
jgi:dTDP-4-dehydrorhamnose reductase